jgi:hypothetical protein
VCEVQRQWRHEFATEPPTWLTTACICDKSDTNGTVNYVHKQRPGMPCTPMSPTFSASTCFGHPFYFQQDDAPPHYHRDVRSYLNENLPGLWIGQRGSVEYPPRSPNLPPLNFYLWGSLKDVVYHKKSPTLETLRKEI